MVGMSVPGCSKCVAKERLDLRLGWHQLLARAYAMEPDEPYDPVQIPAFRVNRVMVQPQHGVHLIQNSERLTFRSLRIRSILLNGTARKPRRYHLTRAKAQDNQWLGHFAPHTVMKTKLIVLASVFIAILWTVSVQFAYHRGYRHGGDDERACWTLDPAPADAWLHGEITARRDTTKHPFSARIVFRRDGSVNAIPSSVDF